MDQKELAFEIARNAFKDKKDKAGKPYFEHCNRVASKFREDPFLYVVAILHDLLEDCPEWNEISLGHLFSENIVKTIVLLTRKKDQDYFDYINKINESSWATKVKLSDLKDNMDVTRLNEITKKDHDRLDKYLKAYKILTA